ncbi:MAG: hypothetical protein HYR98_05390 [Nitrospirae bacterium]|nr:hypothetical protein [Nitrospirota bacterium]
MTATGPFDPVGLRRVSTRKAIPSPVGSPSRAKIRSASFERNSLFEIAFRVPPVVSPSSA